MHEDIQEYRVTRDIDWGWTVHFGSDKGKILAAVLADVRTNPDNTVFGKGVIIGLSYYRYFKNSYAEINRYQL